MADLSDGRAAGTVAGTATSYRHAGLTPASTYQYRVVAVRGGTRSPRSAALAVSTVTPPVSQGRLQGLWSVYAKTIRATSHGRSGTMYWNFFPSCATGVCDVVAHVKNGKYSFKLTLTPTHGVYRGHVVANFGPCGPRGSSIPDPATVKFRVRVTHAVGEGQAWNAISLTGTMAGTYKVRLRRDLLLPRLQLQGRPQRKPSLVRCPDQAMAPVPL